MKSIHTTLLRNETRSVDSAMQVNSKSAAMAFYDAQSSLRGSSASLIMKDCSGRSRVHTLQYPLGDFRSKQGSGRHWVEAKIYSRTDIFSDRRLQRS